MVTLINLINKPRYGVTRSTRFLDKIEFAFILIMSKLFTTSFFFMIIRLRNRVVKTFLLVFALVTVKLKN